MVEINDQVVSQGIVLLSVLTGFAFVISADIALREQNPNKIHNVAFLFFGVGMISLIGVTSGIVYFATSNNPKRQEEASGYFLILLLATGLIFLLALIALFRRSFEKPLFKEFIGMMAMMITILILVLYGVAKR